MVPKPGLSQRGLLKSLKTQAIPALVAQSEELASCLYLFHFVSLFVSWLPTLTPI